MPGISTSTRHRLYRRCSRRRSPSSADAAVSAAARCHTALQAFCADQGVERLRVVNELDVALARGRSGKVQRIVAQPGG